MLLEVASQLMPQVARAGGDVEQRQQTMGIIVDCYQLAVCWGGVTPRRCNGGVAHPVVMVSPGSLVVVPYGVNKKHKKII